MNQILMISNVIFGICSSSDGILWDLNRPLQGSCDLSFYDFNTDEGKHVFWHSSAHVLGGCLESLYLADLTIGPALQVGFYYDARLDLSHPINQISYQVIEQTYKSYCKENYSFERVDITKEEALKLFQDNAFKVELINSKVKDNEMTSAYRCGHVVDLCRGPHLINTNIIKSFMVEKHSSAYWLGDSSNPQLQRIYGISYPDKIMLKEHKKLMAEAKKRDHRLIGKSQNLFFFDSIMSPGSAFWLMDGAKIYNKLVAWIRAEYRLRGFNEVITPNIYSAELFKTSGHYDNYKENMYLFDVEKQEWGLKPMNCPAHCLIFKQLCPSFKHLPIRIADFGVLHRNEMTGSLTGLTRVRRFQQDDAHIFLTIDQLNAEITDALEFLFSIYKDLGFEFQLKLATRPKKYLGKLELWQLAEFHLEEALNKCGVEWSKAPEDGAFYGPKIDVKIRDALMRWHQCGTIQLDFQMPLRFDLYYRKEEVKETENEVEITEQRRKGCETPVMIHRAILGSVERMVAVLLEHTAGKLPFFLSPRQAIICPVTQDIHEYGKYVNKELFSKGFDSYLDDSNKTLNKKIREAQLAHWNYILVVGEREKENQTVTVRDRDNPSDKEEMKIQDLVDMFQALRKF